MEQFELTQFENQRGWSDQLKKWLPRIAAALLFGFIGLGKFGQRSRWITTFEQIGFGQWLRYVTGVLQLLGATLILVPRTFLFGITILSATMLGAMLACIFLLGAPFNAVFPGALLVGLIVIAAEDLVNLFHHRDL